MSRAADDERGVVDGLDPAPRGGAGVRVDDPGLVELQVVRVDPDRARTRLLDGDHQRAVPRRRRGG